MIKSLCMTLVCCPGHTCTQEGWEYHILADFQLGVKLASISLPDICTVSSKCNTCFCNSVSDLIINVHCSGESAYQVRDTSVVVLIVLCLGVSFCAVGALCMLSYFS